MQRGHILNVIHRRLWIHSRIKAQFSDLSYFNLFLYGPIQHTLFQQWRVKERGLLKPGYLNFGYISDFLLFFLFQTKAFIKIFNYFLFPARFFETKISQSSHVEYLLKIKWQLLPPAQLIVKIYFKFFTFSLSLLISCLHLIYKHSVYFFLHRFHSILQRDQLILRKQSLL